MFSRNSIIHTANNSIKLLIVDIDFKAKKIAYFDENKKVITRKKRGGVAKNHNVRMVSKPCNTTLDEMNEMFKRHNCIVSRAEFANGLYIPKSKPVLEQQRMIREHEKRANENYELISPIVNDPEKRFEYLYTDRSHEHIKEISQRTGVKVAQIARVLTAFFLRGGNKNAMYPNYRNCGSNYQHLILATEEAVKRGRISKITNYRNKTKEDDLKIEDHLRGLGKRKFDSFSYQKSYEIFDFIYQSKEVERKLEDGSITKIPIPLPQSQCISYDQFYSQIKKMENDRSFHWSKNGDKSYLKDYESRFGRARDGVFGPSFRYEIDATVEDVYLRFPYFDGQFSSGRPVVYKVKCTYSQMTAGFHVSMDGPNWQGVLQALYNAFTSKVDFCAAYGIDITDEVWPCIVTCNELTIDNGIEYPKKNMQQILLERIGVDCINYTAIYSGQDKGTVEGDLSTTKKEIIKFMPGYVERLPQKGDKHASRRSVYNYEEFVKLQIIQILIQNNDVFQGQLHDKQMSKAGINSTSLEVWKFGMRQYMNNGRGKIFPREQNRSTLILS